MTDSKRAHFYQLTKYCMGEAEAERYAVKQGGEVYIHFRMQKNGKNHAPLKRYAVFRLAEAKENGFIKHKSVLLAFSEVEKIEKS